MLVPSHYPPAKKTDLGSISLTPGPRIEYSHHGTSEHIDSICIDDDVDRNTLGEWLLCHGFITNSRIPVDAGFQSNLLARTKPLGGASQRLRDYNNITDTLYLGATQKSLESIEPKSYGSLYNRYIELKTDKKDLIKSYLLNLNDSGATRSKLLDATYWQITKNYSIIERILGRQEHCPNTMECRQCGTLNIQHHPTTSEKWLGECLCRFMGDSPQREAYFSVINACKKKIRHPTVHESKIATAGTPDYGTETQVINYDLKKTLGGDSFQKNKHALQALDEMMESVAWHLLMHHVFRHGVFANPKGLSLLNLHLEPGEYAEIRFIPSCD